MQSGRRCSLSRASYIGMLAANAVKGGTELRRGNREYEGRFSSPSTTRRSFSRFSLNWAKDEDKRLTESNSTPIISPFRLTKQSLRRLSVSSP